MAEKATLGKQFLEELAGKLPEALRGNLTTIISSPEAQAALDHVGSRVSPLDEDRQRLTEQRQALEARETRLNTWHGQLDGWRKTKEDEFTERERKLSTREGGGNGTGDPPPRTGDSTGASMTKEEIQRTVLDALGQREAGYIQYVADATRFAAFHLQNFKEPLDVLSLVRHEKIGELGIRGVYELVHKDKLDKMTADAAKAAEDAIRADERSKMTRESPVDMPYPIGEGSPLDVLTMDAATRPKGDPATAAKMYDDLVRSSR